MACYDNEKPAAQILCSDSYSFNDVQNQTHAPLSVMVADHSLTPWRWKKARITFDTLESAKLWVHDILKKHPEFMPGYKKENTPS
jgi:methenyltetrahydromethanopterin cyclohydrolase